MNTISEKIHDLLDIFNEGHLDLDQDIHSILELLLSFSEEIDTLKQDIQKLMQKK